MNRHIEKLKRDIAADRQSKDILEIQELAARLEDLSLGMPVKPAVDVDAETRLELVTRAYWSALILARDAIDKAESNRGLGKVTVSIADVAVD
ncbi:MAG: hypothetical protein JXQ99_18330 [Hyphomicrobiaceae bacterium]